MILAMMLIAGFLAGLVLFYKIPRLPLSKANQRAGGISVIIPARNEQANIGNLLEDLLAQNIPVDEIICG